MQAEKIRKAFERAFGGAEVVRETPVISIATPKDEFTVEIVAGRLVWCDFSHTTDLGPEDGSEIIQRLVAKK